MGTEILNIVKRVNEIIGEVLLGVDVVKRSLKKPIQVAQFMKERWKPPFFPSPPRGRNSRFDRAGLSL